MGWFLYTKNGIKVGGPFKSKAEAERFLITTKARYPEARHYSSIVVKELKGFGIFGA